MTSDLERTCQHCGKTNYGVLHHCLKCGAELPSPDENADTMVDYAKSRFEAPTLVDYPDEPDAYLEVISGDDKGNRYELFDGITFGRSKECDIVVDSPKASRQHAIITQNEYQQWLLQDLESTNGTLLNNERVIKPTALYHRDHIYIEGFEFRVTIRKAFLTPAPSQEEKPHWTDFSKKKQGTKGGNKRTTAIIFLASVIILVCIFTMIYLGWSWLSDLF